MTEEQPWNGQWIVFHWREGGGGGGEGGGGDGAVEGAGGLNRFYVATILVLTSAAV